MKSGVKLITVYKIISKLKQGKNIRNPKKNTNKPPILPDYQKQILDFAMNDNNKRVPVK